MLEISDAGFSKPVRQWMDADPPLRACLRHIGLDTNGGATMQEMRNKFHSKVAALGPLPAPGTPEETQGEYGKLTAAYTLLTGRALGVGKQQQPARPAKPSASPPGASWAELQAALEGVGWRTDRCPLLQDGSGHGRRFLGTIYHGGLHFASATATPALLFLVRAGAAPDRAGIPSSEAQAIQRAFLLQLADAICRGAPLVIDLRHTAIRLRLRAGAARLGIDKGHFPEQVAGLRLPQDLPAYRYFDLPFQQHVHQVTGGSLVKKPRTRTEVPVIGRLPEQLE